MGLEPTLTKNIGVFQILLFCNPLLFRVVFWVEDGFLKKVVEGRDFDIIKEEKGP